MRFNVAGIACTVCCRVIEHGLKKLRGIHRAEADLISETVKVSYEPNLVQPTVIKTAIGDLGFPTLEEFEAKNVLVPIVSRSALLSYLFFAAMTVQSFHILEHIAQLIQKFGLGLSQAHGLLGGVFDREWLHFAYNSALLLPLLVIFIGYGLHRKGSWFATRRPIHSAFIAAIGIQSYHVIEHTAKLFQYLMSGVESTPGILGSLIDLVWLHFFINLAVFLPMLLVFLGYGFHKNRLLLSLCPKEIQGKE